MGKLKRIETPITDRGLTGNGDVAVIDAGVDYLTATCPGDDIGEAWYRYYNSQSKTDGKSVTQKDWSFFGYQGVRCGPYCWGYNPRWGYIIRVSGAAAATAFLILDKQSANQVRTTRLDLQVTVDLKGELRPLATRAYKGLAHSDKEKRQYTYMTNSNGGQTLYVGKRTSSRFGRLYDKGAQSGEYETHRVWRFEVEFKKPLASQVVKALQERVMKDPGKDGVIADGLESAVLAEVAKFFTGRGVPFPVSSNGKPLQYTCGVMKRSQDIKTKLHWLRSQVSPSVQELIGRGYRDEALDALGISPYD